MCFLSLNVGEKCCGVELILNKINVIKRDLVASKTMTDIVNISQRNIFFTVG